MKRKFALTPVIFSSASLFVLLIVHVVCRQADDTSPKALSSAHDSGTSAPYVESSVLTSATCLSHSSIRANGMVYDDNPLVLPRTNVSERTKDKLDTSAAHAAVQTFEKEILRWTEQRNSPSFAQSSQPTDEDAIRFATLFKALPDGEKLPALHRAFNLLPTPSTGLLSALAIDKSEPPEILQATFSELANRDRKLSSPILKKIAKDKTHPCYADAEWIFKVIGEPIEP